MTVINVSIQDLALREIEDELRRSAALLAAGHETGGHLWAKKDAAWWRAEGLVIEAASGPGPNAKREPSALTFDTDALDHWDEVMRRDLGLELVGMWHVQPGGDDQPSETDDYRVRSLLFEARGTGSQNRAGSRTDFDPRSGWRLDDAPVDRVSDEEARARTTGSCSGPC